MSDHDSADLKIIATPDTLVDYTQRVTLTVTGAEALPSKELAFEWKCSEYVSNSLTTPNFLVFCNSFLSQNKLQSRTAYNIVQF